jgi:thiamine biosynthesis lipoprotein
MNRRRFLMISAAGLLPGRALAETEWRGMAFGAEAHMILRGDPQAAEAAIRALLRLIEEMEAEFSLHRPSALTRLNAAASLVPSAAFRALLKLADQVHQVTGGAFDPTIQPLWQALATGADPAPARRATGWHRVGLGPEVTLEPGQALTFNGIAQGFASDAARGLLLQLGFTQALVSLGEFAAIGGPFRLGLEDPEAGFLGTRSLTGNAIATSSPRATLVGGQPHILHPEGLPPLWSTVSVEADSAALADALSTACVFLDRAGIQAARDRLPGIGRITLVDFGGDLSVL